MEIKVGVPRGLLYYEYLPLWINFFENLGIKVVVSNKTNKQIMDNGTRYAVDEVCLPVKLFYGHVMDLFDRVDYIFLPRIMSIHKGEYNCPQLGGLPELIGNAFSEMPTMITTDINYNETKYKGILSAYEIGEYFNTNKKEIKLAYEKAVMYYKHYTRVVKQGIIPFQDSLKDENLKQKSERKKIFIIGHSYNLYDEYANMHIIKKIKQYEVDYLVPQMIHESSINKYIKNYESEYYWTMFRTLVGSTEYLVDNDLIDGVIYISSFGCGLDSVLIDIIERIIKNHKLPFMLLTYDEHTGEAGVNTRVEAFIDMLKWRDSSEGIISTYG